MELLQYRHLNSGSLEVPDFDFGISALVILEILDILDFCVVGVMLFLYVNLADLSFITEKPFSDDDSKLDLIFYGILHVID